MAGSQIQAPVDESEVLGLIERIERLQRQLYTTRDALLEALAPRVEPHAPESGHAAGDAA